MCIKNQDVDRMLKGIRRLEKGESADMAVEELAEVMVVFKSLADDFDRIEKALRAELASRMDHEIVLTFADLNRKVQLKEGRETKKIDAEGMYNVMRANDLGEYFPRVTNVVLKKIDELEDAEIVKSVKNCADAIAVVEIGQPYIAVTKMAKGDY